MPIRSLVVPLILAAMPAAADPLPRMSGAWSGEGWVRQTPDGPQEAVRCRLANAYAPDAARLEVDGVCAVPGRRFEIAGVMTRRDDGRVTGYWSNPDGPGRTSISGETRENAVYFAFDVRPPGGGEISQIVAWRIAGPGLVFRATDRESGREMGRIEFAK